MKQLLFFLLVSVSLSAQTVYKTPSGQKYHAANCHTVKNTSSAVSLDEAVASGLDACKICKPGARLNLTSEVEKTPGEKLSSSQCKGKTKAGTRCKHMTKIGNGYCFQHQSQQ